MSKVLPFVPRQSSNRSTAAILHGRSVQPMPELGQRQTTAAADYTVENKGTLLLLRSSTARAYDWLVAHTEPEAHWFGRALVVEYGYIDDFVDRLRSDGFTVLDLDGVVKPTGTEAQR